MELSYNTTKVSGGGNKTDGILACHQSHVGAVVECHAIVVSFYIHGMSLSCLEGIMK